MKKDGIHDGTTVFQHSINLRKLAQDHPIKLLTDGFYRCVVAPGLFVKFPREMNSTSLKVVGDIHFIL
jgi:hypothetical protein